MMTSPVDANGRSVAHELARRYPDARILMVTRSHADVLRSGYSEMVRQGGTMTDADMRRADHRRLAATGHFDYDFAMSLYRGLFGDNLLILPAEWLFDDAAAFTAAIAAFAGVAPYVPPAERVNPSLSAEELYWYPRFAKLLHRFRPGRFRPKLRGVHMLAIDRGWWHPLLTLLRLTAGRRAAQIDLPPELLTAMAGTCHKLVTLPHFTPYRARYLNQIV